MSYRRALLTRWSRRDRLAVLVVAVTVAFLVGTTLLVFAAGAQTATLAAQFDSPGSVTAHESPAAAAASDPDAVVLPLGHANGTTVVGIPENASVGGVALRDAVPPEWQVVTPDEVRSPRTALAVHPDGRSVDTREGANATGVDGAIAAAVPNEGVPLLSALAFFVAGTQQALVVVGVAAACGGLLVGVTTYSVTRMSVRDRRPTIRVVRATGGRPRTVLGLFAVRAGLLTAVGVALGYAVGVIATNAAVNVAVAAGLPTSLAVQVSPRAVRVLVPLFAALIGVGIGSGVIASWSAARASPGSLTDPMSGRSAADAGSSLVTRLRAAARPRILGWRPLVPTAATLTAFVLFVGLAAGLAGVAAPIAGGAGPLDGLVDSGTAVETTTIVQPGSTHPVSSKLPAGYADALRARGANASPEILLFEVVDGQPVPARGANYTAFSRVTDADLVTGRAPRNASEAVIGADAAATLDLGVGDQLLLGGSTQPAVTQVRLVGTFEAAGPFDDQVVVPLATARSLTSVREGQANLIRVTDLPAVEPGTGSGIGVTGLSTPSRVPAEGQLRVDVTVRNDAPAEGTEQVAVTYRGTTRTIEVTLAPLRSTTRTVTFSAGAAGTATVQAGGARRDVTVVPRDALALEGVPGRAPPRSEPLVRVVNASGAPTRATLTVTNGSWNRSVSTGGNGRTRLPLPATSGTYTVRATAEGASTTETTLVVSRNATRDVSTRLTVRPDAPSTLVRPTATLRLSNPWNRTLTRRVQLTGPGVTLDRELQLTPGQRTALDGRLSRQPPGEYTVTASVGSGVDATALNTTYRVTGDDRIVAALATSGRTGTSGIGQAIEVAFGNLGLLVGTLVVLASLMTVGGTTAAFAAAVAARRRTLGVFRATGATPARVARLVLADALRIGVVAALLAVALASVALAGLGVADLLVVFGVRIGFPTPPVLVVCAMGAVLLTLIAAGLALAGALRAPPASLLADAGPEPPSVDDRTPGQVSHPAGENAGVEAIGGDDDD
ncbi:FtsX-like permease family protein [Haloglomus salinum]|uniref:FtsX-like permease family protein n=1 Tax=Haloglomus salinum TaxID=2962673 RepID=UPI0020C99ABC|nr:carboxypeptidase-like regulatory domain-containing protein [Haloglomus salinum]